MISFRLLPVLITLSIAFPLGTVAQPAPENEAALLQEMLRARYALDGQEDVQILVGQLPDSLPADLPLPEEAQIIGSVVNPGSVAGGSGSTEILLRVNQSPEEIYSLYQQQLPGRGWQVEEIHEVRDGFLSQEATEISQTRSPRNFSNFFCSPSQSIYLSVSAQPQTDSSTVVNLSLSAPGSGMQSSECFLRQ
ncbi:MAG: hypothetical protein HC878_17705 [Leptolyngbyaceae cyanobacterium SL_5_14]|nr:hypothetical protein [Leptolyngbyaceae cyanobacterium SL_5_14]